jgi:4-amino-4-deoxy-L-arabinose transferase-like glycosyltransferase
MYEQKAHFQASKEAVNSRINIIQRIYQSPGWIVVIAFLIRFIVALFLIGDQFSPQREHFSFGWETGRIARSIAIGEGFSSPLHGPTGPTAWMTPLYVYLLAAVFKVFGVYTLKSAVVILGLNSIFSALTCLAVFIIAYKSFGRVVAIRAAWVWALFPYAINFAACRVWGDCLYTLLFSLLFLAALRMEDVTSVKAWLGFGLLAGLATLACQPALLVTSLLITRLCYRLRQRGKPWAWSAGLATLMIVLVVSPWFVRNYRTFDRFIPFRSTFWLVMYSSNTGDLSEPAPDWTHPATSKTEMADYRRLGELNYMESKRRQTLKYISTYPDAFISLTARKVVCIWTGFWSLQLFRSDMQMAFHVVLTTPLTILMLIGLFKARRVDKSLAMPYLLTILAFPLVYYITLPHAEYRHPIDPIIVMLAVYGITSMSKGRKDTSEEISLDHSSMASMT